MNRILILPVSLMLILFGLSACTAPGARPSGLLLRNVVHRAPYVPDAADRSAARLAAATLVHDVGTTDESLIALQAFDAARETPTGLAPAALDLRSAGLESGRRHRDAAKAILERDDLAPALRRRLEREREDDPLVRAQARIRDARRITIARAFNTVAEPVGRSILTTALAPIRLSRALLRYALDLYQQDPLPLQRRQALAHWKEFLARYPEAPEREEVELQVADAQVRWRRTRRRQALEQAESALNAERNREALIFADRALRYSPENDDAERILSEAADRIESQRMAFRESEKFSPDPLPVGDDTRTLALAMLDNSVLPLAPPARSKTPSQNAAATAFAAAALEDASGQEREAKIRLDELANLDSDTYAIARHAQAALADPIRNPYDIFLAARWRDRRQRAGWILLGPIAENPPALSLEGAVEAAIDLPGMLQAMMTLPLRILQWPWMPPPASAKVTALQARRYLLRHPEGLYRDEVLDWLADYELARKNYVGALRIAKQQDPDSDHADLQEDAARQALRVALGEQRRDVRSALLTGVTRRFPTTEAGDEAGRLARSEIEDRTAHRIQITRGFLEENPEVAGPDGLDLDPALLDGNPSNGELHSDGIAWVGERQLEFAFVASSGDPDDEADPMVIATSQARLTQLAARLEETSFRNALLDDEDPVIPHANRDLVFERARLGLRDEPTAPATAYANFAYRGMRERYGVVRRREPILPFDLVVQGSLSDLSLGAFPRLREPDKTEDSIRYE